MSSVSEYLYRNLKIATSYTKTMLSVKNSVQGRDGLYVYIIYPKLRDIFMDLPSNNNVQRIFQEKHAFKGLICIVALMRICEGL